MTPNPEPRRLSAAIREVKNQLADRDDVVVELREAQRTRLELLAVELEPVFAEVPAEAVQFDLAISNGLQPRLWIDMAAHVVMGRDRRTYRFLRDTRLGRSVMIESPDLKAVAAHVTRYIAERLVERQRMIDGAVVPVMEMAAPPQIPPSDAPFPPSQASFPPSFWAFPPRFQARGGLEEVLAGLVLILGGAVMGMVILGLVFWNSLS